MTRRFAVAVTAASFLMAGFPGEVSAHDVSLTPGVSRTKVPKGALERGDLVAVIGRVKASDPTCFAGVQVELVRVVQNASDRVLQTTTTNGQGKYAFLQHVRKNQRWLVRFSGFLSIVTGHSHTCGKNSSKGIGIRIQG